MNKTTGEAGLELAQCYYRTAVAGLGDWEVLICTEVHCTALTGRRGRRWGRGSWRGRQRSTAARRPSWSGQWGWTHPPRCTHCSPVNPGDLISISVSLPQKLKNSINDLVFLSSQWKPEQDCDSRTVCWPWPSWRTGSIPRITRPWRAPARLWECSRSTWRIRLFYSNQWLVYTLSSCLTCRQRPTPAWAPAGPQFAGGGSGIRAAALCCTVQFYSAAVTAGPGGLLHLHLGLRALLLWRPVPLLAGDAAAAAAAPPGLRRATRRLQGNNRLRFPGPQFLVPTWAKFATSNL